MVPKTVPSLNLVQWRDVLAITNQTATFLLNYQSSPKIIFRKQLCP